eukprot:366519-Chlamydomonas_euryale.AAC.2
MACCVGCACCCMTHAPPYMRTGGINAASLGRRGAPEMPVGHALPPLCRAGSHVVSAPHT